MKRKILRSPDGRLYRAVPGGPIAPDVSDDYLRTLTRGEGNWGRVMQIPLKPGTTITEPQTLIELRLKKPMPLTITTVVPNPMTTQDHGGMYLLDYGAGGAGPVGVQLDAKKGYTFSIVADFIRMQGQHASYGYDPANIVPIRLGAYAGIGAYGCTESPTFTKVEVDPVPAGGDENFTIPQMAIGVTVLRYPYANDIDVGFRDTNYAIGSREVFITVPGGSDCPDLMIPGNFGTGGEVIVYNRGVADLTNVTVVFMLGF